MQQDLGYSQFHIGRRDVERPCIRRAFHCTEHQVCAHVISRADLQYSFSGFIYKIQKPEFNQ